MKQLFALLLCGAMLTSLSACGSEIPAEIDVDNTAVSTDWSDTTTTTTAQTTTTVADTVATTTTTASTTTTTTAAEEETEATLDQLLKDYCDARNNNDYDAFAACFIEADQATIEAEYNACANFVKRPQHIITTLMDIDDDTKLVNFVTAITSGTYPNTNCNYGGFSILVKNTRGGWKMSFDQELLNTIDTTSLYPEDYIAAADAGRNTFEFNTYYWMHMDANQALDGAVVMDYRFMWQDETGALHVAMYISNGTDANRAIKDIRLSITDSALGTVWEGSVDGTFSLTPGTNDMLYVTIPADQVLTGTSALSSLSCSCDYSNI